jgi:Domain of unknown function (DUF1833)
MTGLSDAAKEALYLPSTDQVFLPLLTITTADLDGPLYLVSNTDDIISNGNTFTAYEFSIDLPVQDDEVTIGTQIVIDNIDRQIMQTLRQITDVPLISLSIVLAATPDTLERGPLPFELSSVDYDALSITGTLVFDSIFDEPSPAYAYTPALFPALFGGG